MKKFRTHCQKELAYLEHLDAIQEHVGLDPDVPMIVTDEARDMAAKLGLAELVRKAPETATLATARVYLAECLAACQTSSRLPREGLLSLQQAAIVLGYTTKGLRKIVARKGIECFQSKRWAPLKFKREWLDEFVERHTKKRPVARPKKPLTFDDF